MILKKLNTQDLLQRRQPFLSISLSWCIMCRNESESVNHLFLHYYLAQRVWTYVLQKFKVSWVLPQDVNQLIEGDFTMHRDKGVLGDTCSSLVIVERKESAHLRRERRDVSQHYRIGLLLGGSMGFYT